MAADRQRLIALGERRFDDVSVDGMADVFRIRSLTAGEYREHLTRIRDLPDDEEGNYIAAIHLARASLCDDYGSLLFDPQDREAWEDDFALLDALPYGAILEISKRAAALNGTARKSEQTEKNSDATRSGS